VCEGRDGNAGHYEESQKYGVSATVCAVFTATTILPQTCDYNLQYQNISTVSKFPNTRTVNSPTVSDALYNQ